MLEANENQNNEILNTRENHSSTSGKISNENTPNIPKKYSSLNDKTPNSKLPSKNNINQFGEFSTDYKVINNKSTAENIVIDDTNFTKNNTIAQNNKKDFIEKKRRRRNK